MTKHLLILSRYSRLGASSRLRTLQYNDYLDAVGFEVQYSSLFDDRYLDNVYAGASNARAILGYYRHRISHVLRKPRPELIWIEYEALPWLPWMIEKALLPSTVPIVCDYDDAIFERYKEHKLGIVRAMLGGKIDRIMRHSVLVTAGNRYIAEHAQAAGSPQVEIVPTVVDLERYQVAKKGTGSSPLSIGWIGTPSTWTEYMAPIIPTLVSVAEGENARITSVGAGTAVISNQFVDVLPWSESTEVDQINAMDIGIMPLTDTPWARGKCGYKLIQYMACGLPVVASPVGVNIEIVEHGVNGFLASSDAEWQEALTTLSRDPELRRRMGRAGRHKVEKQYSLQEWGPRLARMLRNVANGTGT